ncbi:MAG TPA: hypothetical protein VFO93_15235, partial [Hymenobacter sp.]|uniref:hypothetical protein n=1 Tax=Hymenobacter sp. TaxID=1898978 RepID=UPI002D7E5E25
GFASWSVSGGFTGPGVLESDGHGGFQVVFTYEAQLSTGKHDSNYKPITIGSGEFWRVTQAWAPPTISTYDPIGKTAVTIDDKPFSSGALNGADAGVAFIGAALDREEHIVKTMRNAGKWLAHGKIYGPKFYGNQYIDKIAHVKRLETYLGTVKALSKGLAIVGALVSVAQYANGDISGYRATANIVMGIVGTFIPAVGIAYDLVEMKYGDQIEDAIWDGRPKD